jgi:hypothetical protein
MTTFDFVGQAGATGNGGGSVGSVSSVWEKPSPLTVVSTLPGFPVKVFPSWLRQFVEEVATSMQTPVDLPATLALGALATASGGRAVVEVRADWTEPTNLFTAPVMPPGERKSPVLRAIMRPIVAAERTMVDTVVPEIAAAKSRQTVWRDVCRQAEQKAAKAPTTAEREEHQDDAIRAAHEAESVTVPSTPRLLADDATPQALATLLAEQGGRMAVMTDEATCSTSWRAATRAASTSASTCVAGMVAASVSTARADLLSTSSTLPSPWRWRSSPTYCGKSLTVLGSVAVGC